MTATLLIPGRRVNEGETYRTDWVPRGGDCVLLRVQILVAAGNGDSMQFSLQTRGEDPTSTPTITATSTSISTTTTGVKTCIYLASKANNVSGNGALSEVRVVATCTNGGFSGYFVVRIFPLIFFDASKEY